jgi:tRNA-intron endonuclease
MLDELISADLIKRGYRFDKGPLGFTIYIGGGPKIWLWPMSESDRMSISELKEMLTRSRRLKRKLLIGILDKEGDVTYYKAGWALTGGEKEENGEDGQIWGELRGEMVVVRLGDLDKDIRKWLEDRWFGRGVGEELYLEPLEAIYLIERGLLKSSAPEHERSHYVVYRDLRRRGLIPKAGFKYGAHFRVYEKLEDEHSKYLIHVVLEDEPWVWFSFSALIRLAHSVRKEMVFAGVGEDEKIEYIKIERIKI